MRRPQGLSKSLLAITLYGCLTGCTSPLEAITGALTDGALTPTPSISAQVGKENSISKTNQVVQEQTSINSEGGSILQKNYSKEGVNMDTIQADEVQVVTMPTWLVVVALLFAWLPNYSVLLESLMNALKLWRSS